MKRCVVPVLAVGFFVAATSFGGDAGKGELKKLEGVWTMVSGEAMGKELPADIIKSAKLIIKGDKHDVTVGEVHLVGTHKVDGTMKPKSIDSMDTEGPWKDGKALGIYKVEKGTFTVCFAPPGKDRPKEFTTKSGTGEILHVWKLKKE